MTELAHGALRKLLVEEGDPVRYQLPVGNQLLPLNERIGAYLKLAFGGEIYCIHCGRRTRRSFTQGYCYPCFRKLAECDSCILKPEQCHFHLGTCRDETWARAHCMQPHYVYLANSSGLKVGITRGNQIPTRWMDQGAVQALPVFRVQNRYHSGLAEVVFKSHISDRTDWRGMLKGEPEPQDLPGQRDELVNRSRDLFDRLTGVDGDVRLEALPDEKVYRFNYPVLEYPTKIASFNFDKIPVVEGTLQGMKGQYLVFDSGVLNIRKFGGYTVTVGD